MIGSCKVTRVMILPMLVLALSACSGLFTAPVTTPSPLSTNTTTPTIGWFPATVTQTPFPTTVTLPTEEPLAGVGALILSDQFEEATPWTTGMADNASAVVERGRIILTARPKFSVLSLRTEPMLSDFYAEIEARLNLCRGTDTYGLLLRATSNIDYYRFAVNCNGQARAERVHSGEVVPLQDWLPSGDAPTGAPGEVKFGVWAAGGELRFFLNNHYQFGVRDPVYQNGTLGVYIISGGMTETTVSFSDLNISLVSYASPTPSASSSLTPTP